MPPPPTRGPQRPYNSGNNSYPRRPPIRAQRRHSSHQRRPVVRIIESRSCSPISTCSSDSSYSIRYCRSRSHAQPAARQQPIILVPYLCPPQPAFSSSYYASAKTAAPLMLNGGQSISMPHITSYGQTQKILAGPIQYVQAQPASSSAQQRYATGAPLSILPTY
jgi:hypothetical protein